MKGSLRKASVVAIAAASLVAAGAVACALFVFPMVPAALESPSRATSAPVVQQEFVDQRTVQLSFVTKPKTELTSAAAGRVTSTSCLPGQVIESGKSLLSVDGVPLVALATAVPLWRDIASGDKGDDVKALQAELHRLGFHVDVDGTVGRGTIAAIKELVKSVDDSEPVASGLRAAQIVWIPAGSVAVATCDAPVGSTLSGTGVLATLDGGLEKVSIPALPAHLLPGKRVLKLDSASVSIGGDGVITDPSALAQVAATPSYTRSVSSTGPSASSADAVAPESAVSAQLSLSTPIQIAVVPPASVYDVKGETACVAYLGKGYPVSVVGYELGQTFIRFESAKVTARVDLGAKKSPPCR